MGPGAGWRRWPPTVQHKRRNRRKPGVLRGLKRKQMESGLPHPVLFTYLPVPSCELECTPAEEREPGPPYAGREKCQGQAWLKAG